MKTLHFIVACVATLAVGQLFAQPYYTRTELITRDTVTYVCMNHGGAISLYNKNRTYIDVPQTFKNGDPIKAPANDPLFLSRAGYSLTADNKRLLNSTIESAFTTEEKDLLYDKRLIITLLITPEEKGVVKDVIFDMVQSYNDYINVPIETYIKIEKEIKKLIKIPTTEFGRQFNYISVTFSYTYR